MKPNDKLVEIDHVKAQLIELLGKAHNATTEACFEKDLTYAEAREIEADFLITNGVTFAKDINVPSKFATDNNVGSKWISVTERLPEVVSIHKRYRCTIKKSIRVLCVCVQKSGKTMVKEGYCEWYNDYPEPRWQIPGTIDDVTHWMPLPEPPREDKS